MTKKCKPVMLAKELREHNNILKWTGSGGYKEGSLCIYKESHIPSGYWKAQHLYLISDDDIKGEVDSGKADYFIKEGIEGSLTQHGKLFKAKWVHKVNIQTDGNPLFEKSECHKVIASTDPSLNLPDIPQLFLEAYVQADGNIDEVELAMEVYVKDSDDQSADLGIKLKLTPNNEVIVVKITQHIEVQTPAECFKELEEWEELQNRPRKVYDSSTRLPIDQELEDAALKMYPSKMEERHLRAAFKAGALWQQNRDKDAWKI